MRDVLLILILFVAVFSFSGETRIWMSSDGSSKIKASFVSSDGLQVTLKGSNGREIKVPVWKLCKADQELIRALRSGENETSGTEMGSSEMGGARASVIVESLPMPKYPRPSLPYSTGELLGPIEASSKSHYMLYIPTTLRAGRNAPLLFYTHSGGGKGKLIEVLKPAAEINGWVVAISMESRNGQDTEVNKKSCKTAVEHILDTLPVDEDRLYFTGNSGGGAMSFYNYDNLDGYGLMPNVGYNPGVSTPRGDAFVINGGSDFNRYPSAAARKAIGKTAIHRLHRGAHSGAPIWLMNDGMLWLEGRHLARRGEKEPKHLKVYVVGMLNLIEELQHSESHRAYYWATFLRDEIELSTPQKRCVAAAIRELEKDNNNVLYVEGLKAIDELSLRKLSRQGTGYMRYTDSSLASDCKQLLRRFSGVPVIDETLRAMMKETAALKGY